MSDGRGQWEFDYERAMKAQKVRDEIARLEKLHEKNKRFRLFCTYLSACCLIYNFGLNTDWFDYAEGIVVSLIIGGICVFVSSLIFGQLAKASKKEEDAIEEAKKELKKVLGVR